MKHCREQLALEINNSFPVIKKSTKQFWFLFQITPTCLQGRCCIFWSAEDTRIYISSSCIWA